MTRVACAFYSNPLSTMLLSKAKVGMASATCEATALEALVANNSGLRAS